MLLPICSSFFLKLMLNQTRDYINKGKQGNSLTEELIREQIAKLMAAWNQTDKYACLCPNNRTEHKLECCVSYVESKTYPADTECPCLDGETRAAACCDNNFLPASLDVLFDEIPAEDVVRKITEQIDPFLKQIFTEPGNQAFKKYNDPEKVNRWNWKDAGQAQSATQTSGLYSSTEPIMFYNASEVGYPFKNSKTMWETCEGLVRQVCQHHSFFFLSSQRSPGPRCFFWFLAESHIIQCLLESIEHLLWHALICTVQCDYDFVPSHVDAFSLAPCKCLCLVSHLQHPLFPS